MTRPLKTKYFCCPKRVHICQICQIGEGRETLLHSVYGSTVKNLTLTFGPKMLNWPWHVSIVLVRKSAKITYCGLCHNLINYCPFLNDQKESNFHKDIPPLPHLNVLWRKGLFWMCVFFYHRLFLSCSHCCEISSYICVLALYWSGFKFSFSSSTRHDMLG